MSVWRPRSSCRPCRPWPYWRNGDSTRVEVGLKRFCIDPYDTLLWPRRFRWEMQKLSSFLPQLHGLCPSHLCASENWVDTSKPRASSIADFAQPNVAKEPKFQVHAASVAEPTERVA
eukprot:6207994-Pleurochrysis_carterae.AAC.3